MSQKKQFRAQKAKATTKASKSARLPSTEKNAVFTLTGTFQKAKPDKAPGFHFFTEKLSAFRSPGPSRKRNRTKRSAFTSSRKNFRLSAHRDLPESETGQSARLSLLHGKTFGFPLTGTFAKAKPDKTPGFSPLHGKTLCFPLAGTFQKAKPDKAPGFHFFTEKLSAFRSPEPSRKRNRTKQ